MKNEQKLDAKVYEEMAARMTTPQTVIDNLIQEQLGWKEFDTTRLIEGVGNEVYKVHSSQDESAILRVHHGEHLGFIHEKWAMEQAREKNVPVPDILSTGEVELESKVLSYSFLSLLKGTPMSELLDKGSSQDEIKKFAHLAGEILARTHQVQTSGFGHFGDEPGMGEHTYLAGSMEQHTDKDTLLEAISDTDLTESELESIIEIIDNIETSEKPHLIHVDYAPKHIFIQDGKVTGVIDWEICMSGIAATDFNRWRTQDNRIPMKDIVTGYESVQPLPSDFWKNLRTVQLHSALRTILYHHTVTHSTVDKQKAATEAKFLLMSNEPIGI